MRHAVIALFLAACAARPGPATDPSLDSAGPRRNDDVAPPAVLAAARHAVVIYIEATCSTIEQATGRGGGFWVAPGVVATAGHLMEGRLRTFPSFAIVGSDGCVEGRYADWYEAVDTLFLLANGDHQGHLSLATRLPNDGEAAWQISFAARNDRTGQVIFSRTKLKVEKIRGSKVYFGAVPTPREGDSGSPVIAADGSVIGLTIAIAEYKDDPDHGDFGAYMTSLVVRHFLSQCIICEEGRGSSD